MNNSTHLLELVYVGNEECPCIVTAQQVGAVNHEENPAIPAGFANGFSGGLDQMIEGVRKISEVVLQRTSQFLLVGGIRVEWRC